MAASRTEPPSEWPGARVSVEPEKLTLVEVRRGPRDDRLSWRPFEQSSDFNAQWWDRKQYARTWFVQALLADDEVARVQLNPDVDVTGYVGVPTARVPDLEIAYFEVSARWRLNGIGSAVVQAVAERYPDRRLVASSKGADRFWAKLGWQLCHHANGAGHRPPFFIG